MHVFYFYMSKNKKLIITALVPQELWSHSTTPLEIKHYKTQGNSNRFHMVQIISSLKVTTVNKDYSCKLHNWSSQTVPALFVTIMRLRASEFSNIICMIVFNSCVIHCAIISYVYVDNTSIWFKVFTGMLSKVNR